MDYITSKTHSITLNRDNRVLQITEAGYLNMIIPTRTDTGTTLTLIETTDSFNMRRSLTLHYNNNPICFEKPIKNTNVKLDISKYANLPYVFEKEQFDMKTIAIVNHRFAEFALDDYMGNEPGPIKWWNLDTKDSTIKTPKENQWFTINIID